MDPVPRHTVVDLRLVRWGAARATRLVVLVLLACGIGVPTVYLFVAAFSSAPPTSPVRTSTLDKVQAVYASGRYLGPILHTLELALPTALLATLLALVLGLLHAYATPYAPRFLRAVQMAPIFIAPLVSTVGWISLASPNAGLLNRALASIGLPQVNVFGVKGAVVVLTTIFTPYAFVFVSEAISRIGADVYEAAEVTGASGVRILTRVTTPLLLPALLSAFIFTFVMGCEIYSVPSILMAPSGDFVLANVIFQLTTGWPLDYQMAAAVGTLLLFVASLGFVLHSWATRMQGRFTTQAGKSTRPVTITRSTRLRLLSTVVIGLYIVVSVVLPLLGVVVRALVPYFSSNLSWSMFGFGNFTVLSDPAARSALTNSLVLGGASVVVAIVAGGLIGYATIRRTGPLSKLVAFLANIPMGIPGTVLAVGLVWTYLGTPMYGTIYILLMAVFFGWLPMVTRIVQNSVLQSASELEDAADTAGAPWWRRTGFVIVPQIRSSLLMGAALAFILATNEVSAAAILATGRTTPISVLIYHYMEDGRYGPAAVLAILQGVTSAVAASILLLLASARRGRRRPSHADRAQAGEVEDLDDGHDRPQPIAVGTSGGTDTSERNG